MFILSEAPIQPPYAHTYQVLALIAGIILFASFFVVCTHIDEPQKEKKDFIVLSIASTLTVVSLITLFTLFKESSRSYEDYFVATHENKHYVRGPQTSTIEKGKVINLSDFKHNSVTECYTLIAESKELKPGTIIAIQDETEVALAEIDSTGNTATQLNYWINENKKAYQNREDELKKFNLTQYYECSLFHSK